MAFKTPGVYVQEISIFPPSVAEVATAIPAFIGYTEKAEFRGQDLTNKPTKVSSLLESRQIFGGSFEPTSIDVGVDENNNFAVTSVAPDKRFFLFDSLRLFFDNGGGDCYIVSVGNYSVDFEADPGPISSFRAGLKAVEKIDEPTILLFPDGVLLKDESHLFGLQQMALAQCSRLQDRVGLFDLKETDAVDPRSLVTSVQSFRDGIGINSLKYGTVYTPWLLTSYPRAVDFGWFKEQVVDSGGMKLDLAKALTSDPGLNALVAAAKTSLRDQGTLGSFSDDLLDGSPSLQDRYKELLGKIEDTDDPDSIGDTNNKEAFDKLLSFIRTLTDEIATWQASVSGANLRLDLDAYGKDTLRHAVESLVGLEKNSEVLAISGIADVNGEYEKIHMTHWVDVDGTSDNGVSYHDPALPTVFEQLTVPNGEGRSILGDLDVSFQTATGGNLLGFVEQIRDAAATHAAMAQQVLYRDHPIIGNIVEHIKRDLSRLPPSGAVAGIWAFVDRTRGVWKAPANVSLSSVLAPAVLLDDADQEDLNVDAQAGKSINAIRAFTGRGTVVWGARTLAGNDNEWRYISVRRFFNLVEESVKKSTAWAVFEPNAAPLWTKVKGLIDNYLIQKWREGALAGATPEEAFFVHVGLGQTMTAQDILEGRLNVEIGMAVVRPAEFILLKFSHKLQES